MRSYEKTHSFISFALDLAKARTSLWLLLGEAQSKVQHLAGVPMLPEVEKEFMKVYLAKGVLATTAIEGNTLSEEDVKRRIDGNLHLPPSKEYLGKEIDNIVKSCNEIGKGVLLGGLESIGEASLHRFNAMVLDSLPQEDGPAGQYRTGSVGVGRYRAVPAEDVPWLMARFTEWINGSFGIGAGFEVASGLLKAIAAHLYIAWIHPFWDGNGRTARLLEFQILLGAGVPAVSAHLLSNFYNQTRTEYYRHLDRSSKAPDGVLEFVQYAVEGFVDSLKEQIEIIRSQQLMVHWHYFINEKFATLDRPSDQRRKVLLLALSAQDRLPGKKISEVKTLSPKVASLYAAKTEKTVARDLARLAEMKLVEVSEGIVRAKVELMAAFLAAKAPTPSAPRP